MRGETALTRRPVTHPRRLSAGKPQWLPGGAKGCARRDSNPNLLIRRHRPMVRPGTMRVLLSCRWRCREARLSSSLSSELSSAHGAKQRHSHRFPIPGDPALTILCQGWRSHHVPSCISLVWSDRSITTCRGRPADRRGAQVADPRAAVSRAGPHADRGPGQRSPRCSGGRAGRRRAARLTVYRELVQREGKGRRIGSSLTSH